MSFRLILDNEKINLTAKYSQVCPSPSSAIVGSHACDALHGPGGALGRAEGRPHQTLPPLSATDTHLGGHQGRLSKPPSDADHPNCRQKWISPKLSTASVGPLAPFHPALRLRKTVPGAKNPTLSREVGKT